MAKDKAKFWDGIARKYAKTPVRQQAAYEAKLAHTQTFFTPETRLFEFACGTGTTALHHAPHVAEVLATDLSSEMIAIANEKLAETELTNLRFQQWDIEQDPLPGAPFDVAMAHSILHLVSDRELVLSKVHELLKPGGIFVSSTICLGARAWMFGPLIGVMRLFGKAPPVSMLKKDRLLGEIKAAGFEIIPLPEGEWGDALFVTARKV